MSRKVVGSSVSLADRERLGSALQGREAAHFEPHMHEVLLIKFASLFLLGNADEALYRGHERGQHALVELLHGSNVLLLFGTLHGAAKQEINEVGEVLLVALYNCGERAKRLRSEPRRG